MSCVRCIRCGNIESDVITACSKCGGDITQFPTDRRPLRSIGWQLAMFFSGFVVVLPAIFAWTVLWGHGTGYVVLFIGFGLGTLGIIFGHFYAGKSVTTVVLISLSYVLIVGNFLAQSLSFQSNYWTHGIYWSREFFIIPAFVYFSPLFFTYFGVRLGSQKSSRPALLLGVSVLLVFVGISSLGNPKPETKSSARFSFDLVDNEDARLGADVECVFTTKKDYWTFRNFDRGACVETTITVVRKNPAISLPVTGYWTIDGAEEFCSIWPINRTDGGSSIAYPRDFDDIPTWRTELPFDKIKNSKDVRFRWGTIDIDFGDSQFKSMRSLAETLERLTEQ